MQKTIKTKDQQNAIRLPVGKVVLEGDLSVPEGATGLVIFAHGSGSSRYSPRNRYVAQMLTDGNLGTLLFDLLTPQEEAEDLRWGHLRFDIEFLASRLVGVTDWVLHNEDIGRMNLGYFGSSTGAGAALRAAVERPMVIKAVVSRGGRPDLAGPVLPKVKAPTLLIVGGNDTPVIAINREALNKLQVQKRLVVVPGATHLFEEPGTLEHVAKLAVDWFQQHLGQAESKEVESRQL